MEKFQGYEMGDSQKANSDPKRYHRTNEFFNRASEAMDLPWDAGKSVAQAIIRNIIRRITPDEANHLLAQLPLGLKEECAGFATGPMKSITADKIRRDIQNSSGIERVDPDKTAYVFWRFLVGWFNEFEMQAGKGETNEILGQLPPDIRQLFTGREVH